MTEMQQQRIAVFGGAFDPPHCAHLFAIQSLLLRPDVDEVWLVPTYQHVFNKRMTAFEERCDWLLTCIDASNWSKRVSVKTIERDMGGASKTYETLNRLVEMHPDKTFSLVIGADNLALSHRWHRFDELVQRWSLIVFGRPGFEGVMRRFQVEDWCRPTVILPSVSSSMIRAGIQRDCAETVEMIPPPIRDSVCQRFKSAQPAAEVATMAIRIFGLGRVGQSLQHTFAEYGVSTVAWSRKSETLTEHLQRYPLVPGQTLILTVSDPAIDVVVTALSSFLDGSQVVLHCAGARASVNHTGIDPSRSGVLHPIRAIPDGRTNLTHQVWGISGGACAQERAREIVTLLEGEHIEVPHGKTAFYHAAMVVAGNFPLALQAVAESMMSSLDADAAIAGQALQTLHQSALNNVEDIPIETALTGPVARRDLVTIQAHLSALEDHSPELAIWYRRTSTLLAKRINWQAGVDFLTGD